MFAESFGWVGFLVVCFPYKIKTKPTKKYYLLWEKLAQMPLLTYLFLGWMVLGWGVGRFHGNIYMFFNPAW